MLPTLPVVRAYHPGLASEPRLPSHDCRAGSLGSIRGKTQPSHLPFTVAKPSGAAKPETKTATVGKKKKNHRNHQATINDQRFRPHGRLRWVRPSVHSLCVAPCFQDSHQITPKPPLGVCTRQRFVCCVFRPTGSVGQVSSESASAGLLGGLNGAILPPVATGTTKHLSILP